MIGVTLTSGIVFLASRWVLLEAPKMMKMAEQDDDLSAHLTALGCVTLLGVFPIAVFSGLLFLFGMMALVYGAYGG
jgi:hypothetical protein